MRGVTRRFLTDPSTGFMAPNGCARTGRGHGWEIISVGSVSFCLACVVEKLGPRPIYFTGSPAGEAILSAGVAPLQP